jgi:hypothetical protein
MGRRTRTKKKRKVKGERELTNLKKKVWRE